MPYLTTDIIRAISPTKPVKEGSKGEQVEIIRTSGNVHAVKSLSTGNKFTVRAEFLSDTPPEQIVAAKVEPVKVELPPVKKIIVQQTELF